MLLVGTSEFYMRASLHRESLQWLHVFQSESIVAVSDNVVVSLPCQHGIFVTDGVQYSTRCHGYSSQCIVHSA